MCIYRRNQHVNQLILKIFDRKFLLSAEFQSNSYNFETKYFLKETLDTLLNNWAQIKNYTVSVL